MTTKEFVQHVAAVWTALATNEVVKAVAKTKTAGSAWRFVRSNVDSLFTSELEKKEGPDG